MWSPSCRAQLTSSRYLPTARKARRRRLQSSHDEIAQLCSTGSPGRSVNGSASPLSATCPATAVVAAAATVSGHISQKIVLMLISSIWLHAPSGEKTKIRCLLDPGSQRTIIRSTLVQQLGFKSCYSEMCTFHGLTGSDATVRRKGYNLLLSRRGSSGEPDGPPVPVYGLARERIDVPVPPYVPEGPWMQFLRDNNLFFADEVESVERASEIDLVIAGDLCTTYLFTLKKP